MSNSRRHADRLRGAAKLAATATSGVTDVVEAMHGVIASGPKVLGQPLSRPVRAQLPLIYGHVRGVTGLVGAGVDVVLSWLDGLLGEGVPSAEVDAVIAALNGVIGDYLHETGNPLAIAMELYAGGQALAVEGQLLTLPTATDKLLVLVHGSSMNDRQWNRLGHDHGAALARDLGYTPVYLRYNSGLHISTNGHGLSALLEALVSAWPVPVRELTLLGHSMGGLVARSACHAASTQQHRWRAALRRLVCLGTPHHGSPLERGGNLVDMLLGVSHYSAPLARLGQIRSAGVTDLRYGYVVDEDWRGRARFAGSGDTRRGLALPSDVDCFAIAGTLSKTPTEQLRSDGLVPVDSALGRHARSDLALAFPAEHQWVALGSGHVELLSSQDVYERLRSWF
jgi:pimeloyl-ACP methyl ester carboxylesterase